MTWSKNFPFIYRTVALTFEELHIYLDDPWWKLFRRWIWMSFWILLVAIFISSCIISIIETKQQRCTLNNTKSPLNIVATMTLSNFTTWLWIVMKINLFKWMLQNNVTLNNFRFHDRNGQKSLVKLINSWKRKIFDAPLFSDIRM